MSKPYIIKTSIEAVGFMETFCKSCTKPVGGYCPILDAAMKAMHHGRGAMSKEWVSNDDGGAPRCTGFEMYHGRGAMPKEWVCNDDGGSPRCTGFTSTGSSGENCEN